MDDLSRYQGNSINKQRQEDEPVKRRRMEQVVGKAPSIRKKSAWARARGMLIAEDAESIGETILFNVVIPKVKDLLFDSVTEGAHQTLFGGGAYNGRSTRSRDRQAPVQYNRPVTQRGLPPERTREPLDPRERAIHDFSGIVFDNAGEAEEVVSRLIANIAEYGVVSVTDFYDAIGLTQDFTDDAYGWTNLDHARVRRARSGYIIDLPRPHQID